MKQTDTSKKQIIHKRDQYTSKNKLYLDFWKLQLDFSHMDE